MKSLHISVFTLGSLRSSNLVYFFLLYINYLSDDVTCNIDDRLKCNEASVMWQQHVLVSELEFEHRCTMNKGMKWLVGFNSEITKYW